MENISVFKLNGLKTNDLEKLYTCFKAFLKDRSKDAFVLIVNRTASDRLEYIDFMSNLTEKDAKSYVSLGQEIFNVIYNAKKIVIGVADGFIFDGFFELLLVCDFFFSTKKSVFGFPCVNNGMLPAFGSIKLLCRGIFEQFVKYLLLTGTMIDIKSLYDKGIVNNVFENIKECQDYIETLSIALLNKSKFALGLAKETINHSLFASFEDAILIEQNAFCLSFCNNDRIEGIEAFKEKRQANFKSRWEDIYNFM
jgi:enoyl-CoA hydratase